MIEVKKTAALTGHQNPVYALELSQKPGIIFSAGNDKGVVEWSLEKLGFIKVLMPVASSVYALHAPACAPVLAVAERSGQVSIFDFLEQRVTASFHHHNKPVFSLASINNKKELLASSEDGTVSIVSLNSYELLYKFKVSEQNVRCIAISPDEKTAGFGCKDNSIKIYSTEDYSFITELQAHTLPVTSLQFSPDGRLLLSGGRDAQLRIWETAGFSLKETIPAHLFAIYDIKFHPFKPYFATASQDKSIKIWDSETFKLRKIISREKGFESHSHSINKLAWDQKSEKLVSAGDDKAVMVWDVLI